MSSYKAHQHRRSRTLDDREIRALWAAAGDLGIYGSLLKFLLTTGARRDEACRMEWCELKDNVWTLPKQRSKTGEEVQRPLSKLALGILDELPRVEGNPYVFSLGSRPFNSHSRFKKLLDDKLQFAKQWQVHDLRRCARSLLSRANIASDIAELTLGHVLPGGSIRATYDRHKYIEQKRHAFEALANLIENIIDPKANVVALRS
jgi:integrase